MNLKVNLMNLQSKTKKLKKGNIYYSVYMYIIYCNILYWDNIYKYIT